MQGPPVSAGSPEENLESAPPEGNLDVYPTPAGTRRSGLGQSTKHVNTGVRKGGDNGTGYDAHADS
jgi:hypothetical protein